MTDELIKQAEMEENFPECEKEFNLSEKATCPIGRFGLNDWFHKSDIKEFIKRRNEKLKIIEINLTSNDPDDWEIALARVRDLINDKDKLAGDELVKK